MSQLQRITPFLWFETQAEQAANFYVNVFPQFAHGLSWQVVPAELTDWISGDQDSRSRVMSALMKMKKIKAAELRRAAYAGAGTLA